MKCAYGGEVTFTECDPGYRLRILNGSSLSIILSKLDAEELQERIREVLLEEEEPHP